MAAAARSLQQSAGAQAHLATGPKLSVVIATYNRVDSLRQCLEALCHQTQAATDFEVVVVVDGSRDSTGLMLAEFVCPYQLRVHQQPNSGQAAALNRGVELAQGAYCLLLDDDIMLDREAVAEHLHMQRAHENSVGLGHLTCELERGADGFARSYASWWVGHYERLGRNVEAPSVMDCYSGNMAVARAAFLQAGGFATDLPRSYDVDLGYRLQQLGLSFVYVPKAIGRQHFQKGFREIAADAEKSGVAGVQLYQRHPSLLPQLTLAAFSEASVPALLLRRLFLRIRPPLWLLALMSVMLPERRYAAWYAFLHTYFYWRGVRSAVYDQDLWKRLTYGVPILTYHAFGYPGEQPSRYVVPARRFSRQMAWLKLAGYHVLALDELLRYRRAYRLPPARSVVITADDGYADNGAIAYATLRRHGFPVTIFVVSGATGTNNTWDHGSDLANRPLLGWPAIRAMLRGGIAFGSHTQTHPALTTLPPAQIAQELAASRADLERELGVPVQTMSYPYGKCNQTSQQFAEQVGFLGACGIQRGLNTAVTPLFALRRTTIHGTDSLFRFILALWFGYTHGMFSWRPKR